MPTEQRGMVDRFEADLRYGNFVLRQTDLHLRDGFEVALTRSYVSRDRLSGNPVHAFGRNTNHPFDVAPLGSKNPYTYQRIVLEDGDSLYFKRVSDGSSYEDAVYQHTDTATRFYGATHYWNGSGWTTRLSDGAEIVFPDSYNASSLAQGAPTEMRDHEGNRLELRRDQRGNLQEIRTPRGHWMRFTYDGLSRIEKAYDDIGSWARYEYNADGMLTSVVLSSGKERRYDYEGSLMTAVADGNGKVLLRNRYQSGLLIRQEFGDGQVYSYRYNGTPNAYYFDKVVIEMPDQIKREVRVADAVPEFVKNYRR